MNKYNWQDMIEDEPQSIWKTIGQVLCFLAFVIMFLFAAAIGSAYEDHVRCLNGYEEVCIPEDFK